MQKLSQFCHCQDILKFQSLIGNVQPVLTIENIQFKESMFQSLIGNVQLQKKLVNTLKILLFQSLIGNVQPQHFRHFYFPLSPNPPFFASFFQKSRSVSFSKSSIFLDFTAFSRFHKSPLETDRLFYLSFNFPHIQSINKLCKNFYLFF